MIGQDAVFERHEKKDVDGQIILQVRNLHTVSDRGLPALSDVSFSVREGEILGVAGVAGNGQTELAELLTGLRNPQRGEILLDGVNLAGASPAKLVKSGVGHIPEDRIGTGMVYEASVTHNAILREYRDPPISKGFRLDGSAAAEFARQLVKRADVRVPSIRVPARHLSGGNQQRLVAGRETKIASRLLVAVHPTRGLDVGATDEVRRVLVGHRNEGSAVLLISEDLDELLMMSDRIIVMYEGHIAGEFAAEEADREEIGLLMGGANDSMEARL
jgi:simple sugar transport system ATP-binding protein